MSAMLFSLVASGCSLLWALKKLQARPHPFLRILETLILFERLEAGEEVSSFRISVVFVWAKILSNYRKCKGIMRKTGRKTTDVLC